MKNRVRPAPTRRAALALAALCAAPGLHAQSTPVPTLPETRVTATRIPQDPSLLPMGVSVITASEIRASGITDVNEAIRWLGGVITRIDTSFARNPTLDLRGFGETAGSNVVILVDGVRQNEGDLSGAAINWIPVDSIERIEIVRGSGSVLHGEGATAGVINIVTAKGLVEPGGSWSAGIGSQRTRQTSAEVRVGTGAWRHQLSAAALNTDNHRNNFDLQDRSALARSTWSDGAVLLTAQVGAQRQQGGLPGGLNVQEFLSTPRLSLKPNDRGDTRTTNLLLGAEFPLGPWRLGVDVNQRAVEVDSRLVADGYSEQSDTSSTRVGLKAWREMSGWGARQRLLVGVDSERWSKDKASQSDTYGPSRTRIDQRSDALYARHEFQWKDPAVVAHLGARRTLSQRDATGTYAGSLDLPNTSWEIGVSRDLTRDTQVYGRLGTSFRLANADEFSCYGGCLGTSVNLLKPQTSRDRELGVRQRVSFGNWSGRVYQSDLVNEIGLASDQWTNTNYDPTRRRGLELETSARLSASLGMAVQAAVRRAEFSQGTYTGKTVPLVPQQTLTARMTYQMAPGRQWVLLTQWVSDQKIAGDLGNTCAQEIPGYGVTNLRYNHQVSDWTFSAQVSNLFDRHYYDLRTRCNAASRSVYPQVGRALLVSLRRTF